MISLTTSLSKLTSEWCMQLVRKVALMTRLTYFLGFLLLNQLCQCNVFRHIRINTSVHKLISKELRGKVLKDSKQQSQRHSGHNPQLEQTFLPFLDQFNHCCFCPSRDAEFHYGFLWVLRPHFKVYGIASRRGPKTTGIPEVYFLFVITLEVGTSADGIFPTTVPFESEEHFWANLSRCGVEGLGLSPPTLTSHTCSPPLWPEQGLRLVVTEHPEPSSKIQIAGSGLE